MKKCWPNKSTFIFYNSLIISLAIISPNILGIYEIEPITTLPFSGLIILSVNSTGSSKE